MASELSLIYPTIDLFLYDLRDGLGDSPEAIKQKSSAFWQRLPNGDRALVEEEKEGSFIELLPQKYQPLPDNKNGFYYPVKLNDTLALQIDYSANLQGSKQPCKIKTLAENKKFIIRDRQGKPGTLGETWLIWGQLAEIDQNLEETAKQCYAVFSNETWQIEGIIQLEQTKRDRHLNETIFVVSAGIGTASASASSVANFAEDIMMNIHPPQQQPLTTGYLFQIYLFALLLSLVVGFISSVIMRLLMQFPWRKSKSP
ncbi:MULTISPECIES: hypothetical protein [Spirulina sp. CCY15215]|uniref:hypothetical protein n=1 Tax=Spirulina sp. CCY15215 TaxID=2767591 RepID=UPI001951A6D7|nr:hypothetical protein [Spirulina major]